MGIILTLLRYILLYAVIISGSIFIADKANKKIEKCIAPNIGVIIFVLYIFGIFDILKYGVWVVSIINILLGLYTIIKNWKNKNNLKEKILTSGLCFFTITFFILMLTTYNKNLVDYDHYLYRSLNTKAMFYNDTMYEGFASLYPPVINLVAYFFMKVVGVYAQGIEAFAIQMLCFSLLLPMFDRLKNNRFINMVITILIICIPAILGNLIFYEAAYPDALLGFLIGYSMYVLCTEQNNIFKIFTVSLALIIMTLTKTTGVYISAIIMGMYGLYNLLNYKCYNKQNIIKFLKSKELKNIIIITILVISVFISWKLFLKTYNVNHVTTIKPDNARVEGEPTKYTQSSILTTIFGYYTQNHDSADAINNMIPKIYSLYATVAPVRMTIYAVIVLLMIFSLIAYKKVITDENKTQYSNAIISWFVGLIVYVVFLQVGYILKVSTQEMLDHAGLNRYLPTFLLGIIYFIVAVVIKNMEEKKERRVNYLILVVIVVMFTNLQSIANVTLTSGIYNIQSIEYCNNGRIPARKVDEAIEDDAKVVIVSKGTSTNLYTLMMRYYLYPNHLSTYYFQIFSNDLDDIKNNMIKNNFSYIYFFSIDEDLKQGVKKEFDNNVELKAETLYKLHVENDKVELIEIPLD